MCYKFSKSSVKRMQGVHPDLIIIFTEAIKNSPIDFGIPRDGGLRTAARQHEMFLDPEIETKCDGYKNKSYHQLENENIKDELEDDDYGKALDFYAYVNGSASWAIHHLCMVASVIMTTAKRLKKEGKITIDLYWGGQFGSSDFNGWDLPHIQIAITL